MKVSIAPRSEGAAINQEAETELPVNGSRAAETPDSTSQYFDNYATDPATATPEDMQNMDAIGILNSFYGSGPASADQFAHPTCPSVSQIRNDWEANGGFLDEEFLDNLRKNYLEFSGKLQDSINRFEELKQRYPQFAAVYQEVILERRRLVEREIPAQLEMIDNLKDEMVSINEQELANLAAYGIEYEKWFEAYKSGGEYKDQPATMKNRPNPFEAEPTLDINGDARIGTTNFYIASKTVEEDGEQVEITDVIDKDSRKVVRFDPVTGEATTMTSETDPNFHWTISQKNLDLVSAEGGNITLRLDSTARNVVGNGSMSEAAIAAMIPEYVRVDKQGNLVGIEQIDGRIVQSAVEATEGEPDWTLKRIVKVVVEQEPAEDGNGYDYVIKLIGKDELATPTATIRIQGVGSVAASERALALVAAEEEDSRYRRTTGISIDAGGITRAEASFSLSGNALDRIKEEYGVSNPEGSGVFNSAISNYQDTNADMGIIVEGFNVASVIGSNGNDLLLMEGASDELNGATETDIDDFDIMAPQYTTAFDGKGGFNGIFHKKGNVVANKLGFFWGGQNNDDLYLNTSQNHSVYINALNRNGHVSIGNPSDDRSGDSFGRDDDYYGIAGGDFAFANWYEPEVAEYAEIAGIPEAPVTDDESGPEADPEDFVDVAPVSRQEIYEQVYLQIDELENSLRQDALEITDDEDFLYNGDDVGAIFADQMEGRMDTFFAGWSSMAGWDVVDDESMFNTTESES